MVIAIIVVLIILLFGFGITFFLIKERSSESRIEEDDSENKEFSTTQERLPFEYIRNGMVKLKNGVFLKVMEVGSVNTQLMEGAEKERVREAYGRLLNSVKFPIQFYKQSRLVDIKEYLEVLDDKKKLVTERSKKVGLDEYKKFMNTLIKENSVQTKRDFVVITFVNEIEGKKERTEGDNLDKYRYNKGGANEGEELDNHQIYEKAYKALSQRAKTLDKQIRRLGVTVVEYGDQELFNLFYTAYNKDRSVGQSMVNKDPADYNTTYVRREEK